jgi:hypothetical protein
VVAALTVGLTTAVAGAGGPAQAAATITIDPPSNPRSGPVTLTGTVGLGGGSVTSVLYVYDATDSTALPQGNDCSGNGTAGPEDDFNADGSVGDILDCEISGVRALNNSLAGTSGLQAGVVAFANQAATADLDPDVGVSTPFVAPSYTGGDAMPRIETVARSVTQGQIGKFEDKPLGGSGAGTAFNSAVQGALATLAAAPEGPKWIMFLSDGQAPIDDALLDQLAGSGVRLRSFGVGLGATCAAHSSLAKMAAATGESCTIVQRPASLAAGLTGSQPDAINGVTVTIGNVALAASVNPVGGWSATFNLGAGTYTATARAVLASGGTVTAHRTFTVAAGPGGPPPGTVSPGAGSLRATVVKVKRPSASRDPLPSRVTGRVGTPLHGVTATRKLKGAKVLLQVRSAAGSTWTTVDRDRVDRRGRFVLHWRAKRRTPLLRVALLPHKKYAGSAAAVPSAPISACKVTSKRQGWKLSCLTTAKDGSRVRLLERGSGVDTSRWTPSTTSRRSGPTSPRSRAGWCSSTGRAAPRPPTWWATRCGPPWSAPSPTAAG